MNNTPETFPNPEMPTIIHDKGAECPDTDGEISPKRIILTRLSIRNRGRSMCMKLILTISTILL